MGEAIDRQGNVLASAFGNTKKEVFDKLSEAAPNAAEIRIKTLGDQIQKAKVAMMEENEATVPNDDEVYDRGEAMMGTMSPMRGRDDRLPFERRRELLRMAEGIATELKDKLKRNERCFLRQAVEMMLEDR